MKPSHRMYTVTLMGTVLGLFSFAFTNAGETAREKGERIIIPHVEYQNEPLNEVVSAIRRLSKDHDAEGYGINIVFKFTPAGARAFTSRRVTMNMDKISVGDLIEYVCMGTGFKCVFEEQAVVIFDRDMPGEAMQTRAYHMESGVLQQQRTRPKAEKLRLRDDDDD